MSSIKTEVKDRIVYQNEQGKLHREDGPAIEINDGTKEWYLNGQRYSERDYYQEVAKIKLKRILDL